MYLQRKLDWLFKFILIACLITFVQQVAAKYVVDKQLEFELGAQQAARLWYVQDVCVSASSVHLSWSI